jgi:hypothetical protein
MRFLTNRWGWHVALAESVFALLMVAMIEEQSVPPVVPDPAPVTEFGAWACHPPPPR